MRVVRGGSFNIIRALLHPMGSGTGAPYESPEMRGMVKSLIQTINESNKKIEKYNKSMQWMTGVLVALTVVLVILTIVLVIYR